MPKSQYPRVSFHYIADPFHFSNRNSLKSFIERLFKKEKTALDSIQYIFCTDDYLLQINKQYLKHDFYTDIITFNLADKTSAVAGEVYISVDRVRENAVSFKSSFQMELHRVIFHGALHLTGLKDKTAEDAQKMRDAENRYLSAYFNL